MKKEEFLTALEDVLQREEPCAEGDNLADYDEWDSLSKMAMMAYFDRNFGIKITLTQLGEFRTVADLMALAGDKIQ